MCVAPPSRTGGSTLIVDGKRYALKQFHFHHPGEHAVDGKKFPLEIHFVNKSEDGKLAVLGVLVVEGAPSPWLKPLLAESELDKRALKDLLDRKW